MSVNRIGGALSAPAVVLLAIALSVRSLVSGQEPATSPSVGVASTALQTESALRIKAPHLLGTPGKPVAPIAIDYALSAQPLLGVPFDVSITVEGRDGIAALTLTVHAEDGLEVGTPQPTSRSADGTSGTWTVVATVYKEGTSYLGVLAQGTVGGRQPSRDLEIPLRIGTPISVEQTAAAPSSTGSSTQRVIALPGEQR
jgi:hypothetical protein